ncbi:Bromodomain-containing protein, partial [Auricularia subglabra TFB-10046 SS5]
FLKPVDPAVAPGYKDVVKNPMDFGTMTKKVQRGRYKTMDDFTKDFQLVIDNAKLFNPPGSIYYTEAERI